MTPRSRGIEGALPVLRVDPAHAHPQVVVGGQEEAADQDRLDDEQPGEGAAHHGQAHGLGEGVDLRRQPVAGERQGQQAGDGDEVRHVAHPVVVGALLGRLGVQELVGGVGAGDRAAVGQVGDHAVDVDRHPGVVVDRLPDGEHRPVLRDAVGRGHEGQPRIGDEHDAGAHQVEHHAEEEVGLLAHLPPRVVVGVEERRLGEEQQHVGQEGRREDRHQVVGELRVQDDQHEGEHPAERRRQGEGRRQEAHELVGQAVVAHVLGAEADELDDQGEHRHRQDEGGEQELHLGDDPDRRPAADHRERAVLGLLVRLLLRLLALAGGLLGQRLLPWGGRRLLLPLDAGLLRQGRAEGEGPVEPAGPLDHGDQADGDDDQGEDDAFRAHGASVSESGRGPGIHPTRSEAPAAAARGRGR